MREHLAVHLGKSVMAYRLVSRLGRTQFAELVGITRQGLALIESGERLPSLEMLYALGEALDIEPSTLLPTRKEAR